MRPDGRAAPRSVTITRPPPCTASRLWVDARRKSSVTFTCFGFACFGLSAWSGPRPAGTRGRSFPLLGLAWLGARGGGRPPRGGRGRRGGGGGGGGGSGGGLPPPPLGGGGRGGGGGPPPRWASPRGTGA